MQTYQIPGAEGDRRRLTSGVGPLWQKIAIWRPAAVVFIYKRVADMRRPPPDRAVGTPARRRPRRPAMHPLPGPYAPRGRSRINFLHNIASALPTDRA
jgi:hypothetical protein